MKWRRRLIFCIPAALVPAALLFIVLNLLASHDLSRLTSGGRILPTDFIPSGDHDLGWTWQPNLERFHHPYFNVDISTNSNGFRTRPFVAKGNLKRLVLLGDSIAFGAFLNGEQTLGGRIESRLDERGIKVEVFNLGIPSYSMRQYTAAWRIYGKDLRPDVVLLQVEPGDFKDSPPILPGRWARRIPLIAWMQWRLAPNRFDTNRRASGIDAYRALTRECGEKGLGPIVLYFPFLRSDGFNDEWWEDKRELAEAGVPVVNVAEILQATGRDLASFRVRPDDLIHPDKEAVSLVVERLIPMIEEKLARD